LKSEHFNERQLIDYAIRLANGAVFKRLGSLPHGCLEKIIRWRWPANRI